jgi:6-phosphogluconolactonase
MTPERINRRGILQVGIGGIAALSPFPLVTVGVSRAMADTVPETVVYVSNAGSRDISVLAMNQNTGELTLIEKKEVPGSDKSPSSLPMALAPNRRFIYAQLRGQPYPVSTFAIDHSNGKLTLVGTAPLVDQMAYLAVDRSGKHLLGASYVGAKVASYPIDARSAVSEKATQIIDTQPKTHCIFVDAANRHAYVPVLGADHIMQFRFDAASGMLTPSDPPVVDTKAGAGPRHFAFHPSGKYAYVVNELQSTITTFSYDARHGTLHKLKTVSTLPKDFSGSNDTAEIEVHPSGKFLFASNRGQDTIVLFSIDTKTGALTLAGHFPTQGKTPRNFKIDPAGKLLFVANQNTNNIAVFQIDSSTGQLTVMKQMLQVPSPVSLKFVSVE